MKKKAAKIFTAFIMTAIIAQGTVKVAGAAETDSTPDSVAVVEVATPDSSLCDNCCHNKCCKNFCGFLFHLLFLP